jgi:glutathione S-transferase
MKLYYAPGACSLAAHIVIEELGLPAEYEKVDLKTHRTESGADFNNVNPKGYVPFLALGDRQSVSENIALLPFLADERPEAKLAPVSGTMERTHMSEWLGYTSTEIHKGFGPFFGGGTDEQKAKARERLEKRFSFIEERLKGDYLLGPNFTVADAYLFVMLTWLPKTGIDLGKFPKLSAYKERIAHRDAVKRAMRMEGLL